MTIEPGTPEAEEFKRGMLRLGRNRVPARFLDAVLDDEISDELTRELILDVWCAAEMPLRAIQEGAFWWRFLFRRTGFVADTDQQPEMPMTVFRGAPLNDPKGFSWTWKRDVAKWFAARYQTALDQPCGVFSVSLHREHLLGLITEGRGECEVVVDPEILTGEREPKLEEAVKPEDASPHGSLNLY